MVEPEVILRAIDLETTGLDAPADPVDGICEVGLTDVVMNTTTRATSVGDTRAWLFAPPAGIPPEASGVHHLTDATVAGQPPCIEPDVRLLVADLPFALVAHFADFEQKWIGRYLPGARWICSCKVLSRLFPDWPTHNLQAARYILGLELDETRAHPPHRAGPDTYVTAMVLAHLISTGVKVNDMVRWTAEPRFMARCPLAKHKDQPWSEVPHDYLIWITRKAESMDEDTKHWAAVELQARSARGAAHAATVTEST